MSLLAYRTTAFTRVIGGISRAWCVALMLIFAGAAPAFAQVDSEIDCKEIIDPDTKFQAELCSAHPGCKLVFAIHNTCAKAKRFVQKLNESIGEGVATLFGRRKEVTSEAVFEASLSDVGRSADKSPEWQERIKPIREAVSKAGKDSVSGKSNDGGTVIFIGDVQDGKANGAGTRYFSSGEVQRGTFKDDKLGAPVESSLPGGQRSVGNYQNDGRSGYGLDIAPDGSEFKGTWVAGKQDGPTEIRRPNGVRFEGRYEAGAMAEGTFYRPDGSKSESGTYKNKELETGKRFDEQGNVSAEVNKPRDLMLAREARQQAEAERLRREQEEKLAAEQRRRDADAAAAQAFKDGLVGMNAGQLFAKADELSAQGDQAKAREALRTLIARFPDHALALTAAQQLASSGAPAAQAPRPAPRGPASGSAVKATEQADTGFPTDGLTGRECLPERALYVDGQWPGSGEGSAKEFFSYYKNMHEAQNIYPPGVTFARHSCNIMAGTKNQWRHPDGRTMHVVNCYQDNYRACLAEARYLQIQKEKAAPPRTAPPTSACFAEVARIERRVGELLPTIKPGDSLRLFQLTITSSDKMIRILEKCDTDPVARNKRIEYRNISRSTDSACQKLMTNPLMCSMKFEGLD